MSDYRISKAENGFVLEYRDEAVEKKNRKDGAKWQDPNVTKVYQTDAGLIQDLASMLPTMTMKDNDSDDEYAEAFNEAQSD